MSDIMITGRIYTNAEDRDALSLFAMGCAVRHGIGASFGYNLSDLAQYVSDGVIEFDGFIPFCVTDSPYSSECDEIFGNVFSGEFWCGLIGECVRCEHTFREAKFRRVAEFIDEVAEHPDVDAVLFETCFCHGWPAEAVEATVGVGELYDLFRRTPCGGDAAPIVKFTVIPRKNCCGA